MQSKDTSQAYIHNTSFIQNKTAVDAYHKNWRYSKGGSIFLENSLFEQNTHNATVGKKSKVIINNSQIDNTENLDAKSLQKRKIIISHNDFIEATLDDDFFNKQFLPINKKMKGYYEKSAPQ